MRASRQVLILVALLVVLLALVAVALSSTVGTLPAVPVSGGAVWEQVLENQ